MARAPKARGIALTRDLAFASGIDAGNRSMRNAGRTRWSEEDAAIAAETTNRLCLYVPFGQGGLMGLDLTPAMREDLGISEATWERAQRATRIGHNGGPALDREAV